MRFAIAALVGLFVTLIWVEHGKAQFDRRQHRPKYAKIPVRGNFEQKLLSKLNQAKLGYELSAELKKRLNNYEGLKDLLKDQDPKSLEKLFGGLEKFKNGEEYARDQIEKVAERIRVQNPDIDEEQIRRWKQQVQDWDQKRRITQQGKRPIPENLPDPKGTPPKPPQKPAPSKLPTVPPKPGQPPNQRPELPRRQQDGELVKKLKKTDLMQRLARSPEFRNAFTDVDNWVQKQKPRDLLANPKAWLPWGSKISLPRWNVPKLPVPRIDPKNIPVPNFRPPNIRLPHAGPPAIAMPSPRNAFQPFAIGLLVIGSIAVLAVGGYWFVNQQSWKLVSMDSKAGPQLGPWPVDPRNLKTRGDLIEAVDYLALLVIGPVAVNRNHLQIADALGQPGTVGSSAKEQASALGLATLYEQARYSPAEEPLGGDELRKAQQCIAELLGENS